MGRSLLHLAKEEKATTERFAGKPKKPSTSKRPKLEWSPQQQAIFEWFKVGKGHLSVVARAGCAKTTTAIEAINYIVDPKATILYCAYNKRIQVAMAEKITDRRAKALTFHALGFGFVRDHFPDVRVDENVEWDRIGEASVFASEEMGTLNLARPEQRFAKKLLSWAKNTAPTAGILELIALGTELDDGTLSTNRLPFIADVVHRAMLASLDLEADPRISFDDMVWLPVRLNWTKPLYDWVIVDEQQDMNDVQLALAKCVVKPIDGHLVGIGDDKQCIYAFRGADPKCLERFREETGADKLTLTVTYRCPRSVVEIASELVPDFTAAPSAPAGEVIDMTWDEMKEEAKPGDVILSRVNAPLVGICLSLIARRIPAIVSGRDIADGLVELARKIRASNIDEFDDKLTEWEMSRAARIQNSKMRDWEKSKKLEETHDRVACLRAIADTTDTVSSIPETIQSLFSDRADPRAVVTCSTVHKAKGLEWPRVFLLEETLYWQKKGPLQMMVDRAAAELALFGALPLKAQAPDPSESNIHYVAVTRAQETLVLVKGMPRP